MALRLLRGDSNSCGAADVKTNPVQALFLVAASVAALFLSACNTIEGAGEDIQSGGEAIERSAEDTKRSM